VFEAAEGQVGAAVRTIPVQQAQFAIVVAEQDHVLPKQLDGLQRPGAVQFLGQGDGLPVAAQQLAGRGVRTHPGHEIVLFCSKHGSSSQCGWTHTRGPFASSASDLAPRSIAYSFTISGSYVKWPANS